MKSAIISMAIVATILVTACQKENSPNSSFKVNIKNYEAILNKDYTYAAQYHNALYVAGADTTHFKLMFNNCDSLFSEHFYAFCIDMMQNSGMMSTTEGMMGGNSGMMGNNGGMMNGNNMVSMTDMNSMMQFMDSVHRSAQTMPHANYMETDSLMHNQITMCKMMSSETDSIDIIYSNMYVLRTHHKKLHGK